MTKKPTETRQPRVYAILATGLVALGLAVALYRWPWLCLAWWASAVATFSIMKEPDMVLEVIPERLAIALGVVLALGAGPAAALMWQIPVESPASVLIFPLASGAATLMVALAALLGLFAMLVYSGFAELFGKVGRAMKAH